MPRTDIRVPSDVAWNEPIQEFLGFSQWFVSSCIYIIVCILVLQLASPLVLTNVIDWHDVLYRRAISILLPLHQNKSTIHPQKIPILITNESNFKQFNQIYIVSDQGMSYSLLKPSAIREYHTPYSLQDIIKDPNIECCGAYLLEPSSLPQGPPLAQAEMKA